MTIPSRHPQEIEVWYILPAIRKELVLALKEKGHTQKHIAAFLNVTEPAVSQYTKEKRAQKIRLNNKVKRLIREAAEKIKDTATAYRQIQKICEFIRNSKALCGIHMQLEENLKCCDICYRKISRK
ncbi:MAG: transcriptional regulator [Nanoarchaeota archaeon]